MPSLSFDNAFIRDLPGDRETGPRQRQVAGALYSRVEASPVKAPRLLAYAPEVAQLLGLSEADVTAPDFAEVFAGNKLWPGMEPYAANYGGHQFGNWAGQLGDGRAINLGEVVNSAGERWEIQLKGAGLTPYSRHADGRAVLRSSIREFLCSEAMHHLGVPTTRALCLVATGEEVVRDMFYDGRPRAEPGAIVCRVAPSFIRFGNFELPAARGDTALVRQLADFTIRRDFPHLAQGRTSFERDTYQAWFAEICARTARLIGHWMRVGFVHGVMNTDNMSILGLTIDYGPYGWVDNFDPGWTPNTTDRHTRRYRFGQQASVAYWNLTRLAGALISLFEDAVEPLQAGLQHYADTYMASEEAIITGKLGLRQFQEGDRELMIALQEWMTETEVDMTLFFRALADLDLEKPVLAGDNLQQLEPAFYDAEKRQQGTAAFNDWLARYAKRVAQDALPAAERRARMNAVNPRYVLRNYLAQQAIDRAEQGDTGGIHELLEVMRRPYEDQPGREAFAERGPDWARNRAGCSMLSCSS